MARLVLALSFLALLLAPVGAATWSAHGGWEPDHAPDADLGLMWRDPDTSADGARVYFNAYPSNQGLGANPNAALAGSRILTNEFILNAYLGVWKDCNNDGYIGLAETVMSEYPVELLLATDPVLGAVPACSVENGHVRDGWVYEFLWIGNKDNVIEPSGAARYVIDDDAARVWADMGLPGEVDYTQQVSCSVNPPDGALSSTGGLLGWLDCSTGYAAVGATNAVDREAGTSLGFGTVPPCSSSPLNVGVQLFASDPRCASGEPGLLGHDEELGERRAVTVTDCGAPLSEGTTVEDPSGEQTVVEAADRHVNVSDPDGNLLVVGAVPGISPAVDPQGSLYDSANGTVRDASGGGSAGEGAVGAGPVASNGGDGGVSAGACDPAEGDGVGYTTPESTIGGVEAAHRNPDLSFAFYGYDHVAMTMIGPGAMFIATNAIVDASAPLVDLVAPGATDGLPRSSTETVDALGVPPNAGLGFPHGIGGAAGFSPVWTTPLTATQVGLVRSDLTAAGPTYYTAYAYVGATTLSLGVQLPSESARVYGQEWCAGATSGTPKGFDCDATNWWDMSKGAADESLVASELWSGRKIGIRTSQPYQLRDIDCYDGSLTNAAPGVGLGLTTLSAEGPCA